MIAEKRKHSRKPVDLPASVRSDGQPNAMEGRVRDLSIGGAFLLIDLKLPFGTKVEVTITFPGPAGALTLPAVVRWSDEDGLGLQFGLLGARETHAIALAITAPR